MARNTRRSRGMKKIDPAVQELHFNLPAGTQYVDLNQCLSIVNRRLYRQGLVNAVSSIEVQFTPNPGQTSATGSVVISKLPQTWVMFNAWEKGFRHWMEMNNEALAESESVRPRYLDFKIYADADHHTAGFGANLKPTSGPPALISVPNLGDWDPAEMQIPVGTAGAVGQTASREIIATGGNYPGLGASGLDAVSLIEGYAASRALPPVTDPNVPGDAADVDGFNPDNWLAATFNEGTRQTEQVLDEMLGSNNSAPYPFEGQEIPGFPGTFYSDTQYPGGANQATGMQFHDRLLITTSTIGGSDTAIGGAFSCGLIRFDTTITDGTASLIIRTAPGSHRGYMSLPMQEM